MAHTHEIKKEVTFEQLSIPMKIAVIGGWVSIASYCLAFIIGFLKAMIGG